MHVLAVCLSFAVLIVMALGLLAWALCRAAADADACLRKLHEGRAE